MSRALCAALLLLHALALASVTSGMHPTVNPRGWKAAREAERRAARWVPPTVSRQQAEGGPGQAGQTAAPGLPPPPAPIMHQTCRLSGKPEYEALQRAAWQAGLAVAGAAFALGLLCGVLLHIALQRRWKRQRGTAAHAPASTSVAPGLNAEQEETCVPPSGAAGGAQKGAEELKLQPAGQGAPKQEAADELQASMTGEAAATAAEAAGSTLAAAAAAARAAEEEGSVEQKEEVREGMGESGFPEAAVAAAVQELVLQQGSSDGAASSEARSGSSKQGKPLAGSPGQLQQRQQLKKEAGSEVKAEGEEQHQEQGALAVAAGGGGGGAVGGALGALRSEDRADVAAAAQLVLTMCRSMAVEPGQLSQGERLQLIYTMLQAWQAQQARRHAEQMHRLGSEANILRSEQRDIAARQAAQKAAKDAYRLSLERTADFRRMCSDTLTFGLAVMLAAVAYQLASRGLLLGLTANCGSWSAVLGGARWWGLWSAWRVGETAVCYVMSIGDALLGLAVLLAAPWLLYRSGLMSDYHAMPVTKLFIGLGLICGLAGYLAVGKLGGSRATWLATWQAWVALHIALSAAAHRVQRISLRAQQGGEAAAAVSMYEQSGGWLTAAMWVGLGLVLPALAGTLPFR